MSLPAKTSKQPRTKRPQNIELNWKAREQLSMLNWKPQDDKNASDNYNRGGGKIQAILGKIGVEGVVCGQLDVVHLNIRITSGCAAKDVTVVNLWRCVAIVLALGLGRGELLR